MQATHKNGKFISSNKKKKINQIVSKRKEYLESLPARDVDTGNSDACTSTITPVTPEIVVGHDENKSELATLGTVAELPENPTQSNLSEENVDYEKDCTNSSTTPENILDGRMIVQMDFLIEQLTAGCRNCNTKLDICDITQVQRHGLANNLKVKCTQCPYVNSIATSRNHLGANPKSTRPIYDVNTKCAAAMLHAGMGVTHVNTFLATLEIKGLQPRVLKEREREITGHLQQCAKESCNSALLSEIELSQRYVSMC